MITFPECLEQLFQNCLRILNGQLQDLGLSPADVEMVINEKRTIDQPGYNKVVIVTDMLAERAVGRLGDGEIVYPFEWDDKELGKRLLSVDGKWNCLGLTPEACCDSIKQSTFSILYYIIPPHFVYLSPLPLFAKLSHDAFMKSSSSSNG